MYSGAGPLAAFCQTCLPVAASNAVMTPVIPIAYSRPFERIGVDFGPGPCRDAAFCIVNDAGYPLCQITFPVSASRALMTSSSPCRENM